MSLYFVYLRKPQGRDDRRNDPFWEFGSFGRTCCHKANLLHPRRTPLKDGDRLAFLQGGVGEVRIVGVPPLIAVAGSTGCIELEWDSKYRPLPYLAAPLLINNSGETAFPKVRLILNGTRRSTFCAAAASRLRGRTTAVDPELSKEILRWFASTDLPKIAAYPEAIQSKDGLWYKHAMSQGWANASARLKEYKLVGQLGNLSDLFTVTVSKAPKGPKSRC